MLRRLRQPVNMVVLSAGRTSGRRNANSRPLRFAAIPKTDHVCHRELVSGRVQGRFRPDYSGQRSIGLSSTRTCLLARRLRSFPAGARDPVQVIRATASDGKRRYTGALVRVLRDDPRL